MSIYYWKIVYKQTIYILSSLLVFFGQPSIQTLFVEGRLESGAVCFLYVSDGVSNGVSDRAIAFSPAIRIQTRTQDNHCIIKISNNGALIPEDTQRKIFDPFFTTKDVGKGTGMGLAVSYQTIVKMHGGKLECFSVEGRGAEFMIELPIKLTQKENLSLAITDNLAKQPSIAFGTLLAASTIAVSYTQQQEKSTHAI